MEFLYNLWMRPTTPSESPSADLLRWARWLEEGGPAVPTCGAGPADSEECSELVVGGLAGRFIKPFRRGYHT